jgi:hypothetical protein
MQRRFVVATAASQVVTRFQRLFYHHMPTVTDANSTQSVLLDESNVQQDSRVGLDLVDGHSIQTPPSSDLDSDEEDLSDYDDQRIEDEDWELAERGA